MSTISNVFLIAFSLSLDAFALAASYGLLGISKKKALFTATTVGIFHFLMPYVGSLLGNFLFDYVYIKPKIIVFLVFFCLSINMFISFFDKDKKTNYLNLIEIILFAFSVSIDSFSVGLTLNYIASKLLLSLITFSIISFSMTVIGFILGKYAGNALKKYSYLIGGALLLFYSLLVLTK